MTSRLFPLPLKRFLAALLAFLVGLGPLATPQAFAALTQLADEPLNVRNSAQPNIVLTIDDSTSMLSDFLPDYVVDSYCRDNQGRGNNVNCGRRPASSADNWPAFIFHQSGVPYNNYDNGAGRTITATFSGAPTDPGTGVGSNPQLLWPAPVHSAALNKLYYNPRVTYEPPVKADGTSYPSMNAANTTTWTKVPADPWRPSGLIYVNLSSQVTVGRWCNSDWAAGVATFANDDDHCRTNGTGNAPATGLAVSGTFPAAVASTVGTKDGDYLYPWPKPGASTADPKYYAQQQSRIWCDKTHPNFPQTATGCTTTSTPTGTFTNQTCNKSTYSCAPCTDTYNPPGCNLTPCTGTECPVCLKVSTTCSTCTSYSCSITGKACTTATAATACPPQPNYTSTTTCTSTSPMSNPGCGQKLWNPVTKANDGITMLADANGAGTVCRHNNQAYTGVSAARYTYPAGNYNFSSSNMVCSTGTTAAVPRHYWKVNVEWCNTRIATTSGDDKWRGFGTGTCKPYRDATYQWPRYHRFGSDGGTDNVATPAFERVDLHPNRPWDEPGVAAYVHAWKDELGVVQTVKRSFAEEMENYANWFAYYRTRIQATKTATSLVFKALDNKFRLGFHTLSNKPAASFVDIQDFAGAQRADWYNELFNIYIPLGNETPNLNAIVRVGEYFKNGASVELAGATDPIKLSCQKNWHMLFTDGITNQPAVPTMSVGNADKTIPNPLPEPVLALPGGTAWPDLFIENPLTATNNSASDYTTFYWVTDLRNNALPTGPNNVPDSARDPAKWQHVNFAAISLGTEGKLAAGNQTLVESQLSTGATRWSVPTPSVNKPDASGVDDLWHAAINGRGRFVNAQTVQEVRDGMEDILSDITNQAGSRAGVGFENVNLTAANNYIYRVRFEPGWAGSLTKVQIDPMTAVELAEIWRASDQLDQQLLVVPGVKDTPWFTERRIATINSATNLAVPLLWGNLSAAQQDSLARDHLNNPLAPARGQAVLEFLRGNRGNEGTKTGQFRQRGGPLGDIVNSSPVVVGAPIPGLFADVGYDAFAASYAGRARRVYVGANDGMLHAFDDATGREAWAFMPKSVFRGGSAGGDPRDGVVALSYKGLAFDHRYYVDATPRISSVDFGGSNWKTLLVGGLGKGGRAYYAIDITEPASIANETDVAAKVLWEFANADMGYSYGRALIVKTYAHGWVVVIPVGYNNPSGEGKLFFVKASDGSLLKTMATGAGTPGTPAGLAHVSGYVKNYRNQVVEQLYAGDLLGNLWRFDVDDPNPTNWTVKRLAVLTDSLGTRQPVTTPPQIEVDVANGVDRWVFVGTGRVLHEDDLPDTQVQTMYAIRDGTSLAPKSPVTTALTRSDLVEVTDAAGLANRPDNGWYDDLPAGQKIIVPPQAELSIVAYVGTSPRTDPCLTGMPATVYAREYGRGGSRVEDTGGNIVESIDIAEGVVGIEVITMPNPGGGYPEVRLGITQAVDGRLRPIRARLPDDVASRRLSWRLLNE